MNNFLSKYIKKQDPFWYERYKYYRNKVNMLISKSKKNCLREYFQEIYNNSKKIWTKINELPNKKHKKTNEVLINKQGCIIIDQEIVANKFNNYFVKNLLKDLEDTNNNF